MQQDVELHRIIPTYVGSTPPSSFWKTCLSNHSHVCGINKSPPQSFHSNDESFPRMWDQLCINIPLQCYIRIIPTYVGSTPVTGGTRGVPPNHSHVCGINATGISRHLLAAESFPRMWDQPPVTNSDLMAVRIIPTYVGSTYP